MNCVFQITMNNVATGSVIDSNTIEGENECSSFHLFHSIVNWINFARPNSSEQCQCLNFVTFISILVRLYGFMIPHLTCGTRPCQQHRFKQWVSQFFELLNSCRVIFQYITEVLSNYPLRHQAIPNFWQSQLFWFLLSFPSKGLASLMQKHRHFLSSFFW